MTLLQVENVRKQFGGLTAVDNVSFQVEKGMIKALIGPNGAGKTTLFNIISGLLKTETGRIEFKERLISKMAPHQIAAWGMARTFQNPTLFLQMSVLANVMVGMHSRSQSGFVGSCLRLPSQRKEERRIRDAAMAQIAYVGLESLAHEEAGRLAFGQRRLIELARALASRPDLLLLDEPASGLNTKETEELGILIQKIRDQGITILLVEHDMSLVMDISDEILVLHNGARIAEGTPTEIQNDPDVISVYLGGGLQNAAAS